jgi:glycine dehydrogenase
MVEPTESEDLGELDRFVNAMIAIRREIAAVKEGRWPSRDNPLVNAPHTAEMVTGDDWEPRVPEVAGCLPEGVQPVGKYWAPVRRIDGAYGDRNLVCACSPAGGLRLARCCWWGN